MIIGAGPAGLSAALSVAENSRLRVLVVDENQTAGGQIWRAELGQIKSERARRMIKGIRDKHVQITPGTQVFGRAGENSLLTESQAGVSELSFEKLILATGARERFLPFPNWTLPNIFGAGGLQALVKNGLSVEKKKIVVSGTGPLLLAAAEFLNSRGASVLLIAEQAKRNKLIRFGLGLFRYPGKLMQAVSLRAKLAGIPYLTDSYVAYADGDGRLESVRIVCGGRSREIDCDMLACGFHLVPNNELAALLGCKIEDGFVLTDEFIQTSENNIYGPGELNGIGGVDLSLLEGRIAGLAAIGEQEKCIPLISKRRSLVRFAAAVNHTFALRALLKDLPKNETILCRCEDVSIGEISKFTSFREAKLQARCGMGACQGRICGSAGRFLFDWEEPGVRAPIYPVKLENLTSSMTETL